MGRKSIRTCVPMFWSVFSSKNIYKINENTSLSLEKTLHQDDNLLRRKAFDGSHPKGLLMARDTLIYLLQNSGFLINIQKSVLNPTSTFGIFRSATNSRHDIESPKRENFENAATMQKDSELAIKTLSQLIGRLASTAVAILPAPPQYKALQRNQIHGMLSKNSME